MQFYYCIFVSRNLLFNWEERGWCKHKYPSKGGQKRPLADWGFCSASCGQDSVRTLQNVSLYVLAKNICRKLTTLDVKGTVAEHLNFADSVTA